MESNNIAEFEAQVALKFKIFNGLFLSLPFKDIDESSARLLIFTHRCETGITNKQTPLEIVETYLSRVNIPKERHLDLLFKFIQFIERQIVLFDALEDASFPIINNLSGKGSVNNFINQVTDHNKNKKFETLLKTYKTRIVLTAHPTQFYPDSVLGIILKMGIAIKNNNLVEMQKLFLQMGFTRFSNKNKPTPIDEVKSLIWYLKHIFYTGIPKIQNKIIEFNNDANNIDIGFWPGGDRDGNPFVTADTTIAAAKELKQVIMSLYYNELVRLVYNLTFDEVNEKLNDILIKINNQEYMSPAPLINDLIAIQQTLNNKYQGLFVEEVNILIIKIRLFGFYFAKIDIRQNSKYHEQVIEYIFANNSIIDNYRQLPVDKKISLLTANLNNIKLLENIDKNPEAKEQIQTMQAIYDIQQSNGINSIERYIISNTASLANIFEVLLFISLTNISNLAESQNTPKTTQGIKVAIVPLFETIDDLNNAPLIMEALYKNKTYQKYLKEHSMQQTIMLGFSDGTKDGGYLKANWSIYLAKKHLSELSTNYGISVVFFDGRGGPPARGGGNTRDFYHSMGKTVAINEIQLTIQGQTVYSNFGNQEAAIYNIEQLFTAGLTHKIFPDSTENINLKQEKIITTLANSAYQKYLDLKNHPLFIPYLEEISTLKYLAQLNVGSRPAKRNKDEKLKLEDLRAIPFVSAWTQLKQNILGFYGVGHAISHYIMSNKVGLKQLQDLYKECLFFRGLIDNAMQSLAKSNFAITAYLANDDKFSNFWQDIKQEADLTTHMLLKISKQIKLLETNKVSSASINMRERIIFPLLIIQQYAMMKLRNSNEPNNTAMEKLVLKSLAANINASRNSI